MGNIQSSVSLLNSSSSSSLSLHITNVCKDFLYFLVDLFIAVYVLCLCASWLWPCRRYGFLYVERVLASSFVMWQDMRHIFIYAAVWSLSNLSLHYIVPRFEPLIRAARITFAQILALRFSSIRLSYSTLEVFRRLSKLTPKIWFTSPSQDDILTSWLLSQDIWSWCISA